MSTAISISPEARQLAQLVMQHRCDPVMQVSDFEVEFVNDLVRENLQLKRENAVLWRVIYVLFTIVCFGIGWSLA